jgi:hypothetical protein
MKFSPIKMTFLFILIAISSNSVNAQHNDATSLLHYLRGMINQNEEIEFANVYSVQTVMTENIETGSFETIETNMPYSFSLSEQILSSTSIAEVDNTYLIPFKMLVYSNEGELVDEIPSTISFEKDGSEWKIVNITDKNDSNWKSINGNWTIVN